MTPFLGAFAFPVVESEEECGGSRQHPIGRGTPHNVAALSSPSSSLAHGYLSTAVDVKLWYSTETPFCLKILRWKSRDLQSDSLAVGDHRRGFDAQFSPTF